MSDFKAGDRITNDTGLIVVAQMGPDDLAPGWRLYAKAGEFVVGDRVVSKSGGQVFHVDRVEKMPSGNQRLWDRGGYGVFLKAELFCLAAPDEATPDVPARDGQTRSPDIDLTKIQKGDVVGIDFEVRFAVGDSLQLKPLNVRRGDVTASLSLLSLPAFWVTRHEPAPPKPIKVGDRVIHRKTGHTMTGSVLHLASGEACILSNDGFMFVYDCDALEQAR